MAAKKPEFILFLTLNFVVLLRFAESVVPQQEEQAVGNILAAMNATSWRFNGDSCNLETISEVAKPTQEANASVGCDCTVGNDSDCHVVRITHKFYSLDGVLSPELAKLPYLRSFDVAYNYLQGTIPPEWGLTQLQDISLLGNRLTGEIPPELGNITTLTKLDLEANQLSGTVPRDLGRLINLKSLILSSNRLTGRLPTALGQLGNLTNFRINENNFNGLIPDFIQNWRLLSRLEIMASGLGGPIPSNISFLENLVDLRISDITGPTQGFPPLNNATGLIRLILRNCNLSGELPAYIWQVRELELLDTSFNRLVGRISNDILGRSLRLVFLTGNMLSGDIPDALLVNGASIDLSYNNLTWQGPNQPTCRQNTNWYVNLFRSSSTGNPIQDVLPCAEDIECPRYTCSLHVNCGGDDLMVTQSNGQSVLYEGDANVDGGAAKLYETTTRNWGFSSTGDFMDDNIYQNTRYIDSIQGNTTLPPLYTTARLSPMTLTYFSYCLENGEYGVDLHFAEIQFTNDSTYRNLGRRIFDIYIQGRLVRRDFNIEDEAHGFGRSVVIPFNASVTNNILEIRFYWAGKGTTRFPKRGVYGPLVSAIDVNPHFKTCSAGGKKASKGVYIGVGIAVPCLVLLILVFLWRKKCFRGRKTNDKDFEGIELKTLSFSLKQLKSATNNFNASNKVGEGGFGAVYKGTLPDGTVIAVKQLSSHSKQGNREFLNEMGVISCLQHPNLVKLHGCCIEGDQLLLVYEYLENNSLANALFDSKKSRLMLDWPTRFKICIGIAKGLAFLHDESRLKIVHRDIKATNVLLDKDLNPKISDFGLARLNEDEKTHVSTRVAGTIGYMAPEYALWGYLSDKADVYSFGVVVLEIVSGKNNNSYIPTNDCICLLDWACRLETSKQYEELFDERLESKINKLEAETVVKVALLCTNGSPSVRPTMSEVVNMLEGKTCVPEIVPAASGYSEDLRFRAMRDFRNQMQGEGSQKEGQTENSNTNRTDTNCSLTSSDDAFEIHSVDTRSY
ncbi:probable LRR receptor-like serine/threonine-protein kinase RFK1 [Cynara cardunculus var. scolymus]|uniref:probable LRR receptor-like serine/threonine-protein kinase RFK1 n=1 Tax=Cynara cardunculus var. scolymus TaxID=59895 RepID=UPI000D627D70|nr:probable LRR receptor-like serine/threonine-protein kinase RFK1 [Cynara cardunculus var. scolymus]